MIVFDPSDIHSNSRVPNELIAIGNTCEGLEALTGCDFMISPLDGPPLHSALSSLGKLALKKHIENGALLYQRKSGGDVINIIKDGAEVIAKMLEWTDRPQLLTIGNYLCDKDGKLVVDGKRVGGDTGWSYWAFLGAINSWQERGGYYTCLARDSLLPDWYDHVLQHLKEPENTRYIAPRKPSQTLIASAQFDEDNPDAYQRACAISALATIEGISISKAATICDYTGNELKNALVFLSDPDHLKLPGRPKGIGSKIFANASSWLGLQVGGIGEDQWREVMLIDTVYPQRKSTENDTQAFDT